MGRFLIRVSAFLRKEIVNVLRQPQLMATLVLGPFLILFLFGVGFRQEARTLRTLFVADPDNVLRPYIDQYATTLGPQLIFVGIAEEEARAVEQLRQEAVDSVVIVPRRAFETIQNGEQAIFQVYHNEIEPTQAGYVEFTMDLYLSELNRRVLSNIYEARQDEVASIQQNVKAAQEQLTGVKEALNSGELTEARQSLGALQRRLERITPPDGTITETLREAEDQQLIGSETWISGMSALLTEISRDLSRLADLDLESTGSYTATLSRIDADLEQMDALLNSAQQLPAAVLVSPFDAINHNITPVSLEMTDYYAPGVIALLLQHLGVTFAALSIVQEDLIGAITLFQVAPLSSFEILLGKYISFILLIGIVAAGLSLLIIYVLDVPFLGEWVHYALALLAVIFTSLSVGFLVSLLSKTTGQAVQASMILLLSSVFFTGFFQRLQSLRPLLRVVSWSLPATYGIRFLQTTMLRGRSPGLLLMIGLTSIGAVLFGVNLTLLRQRMRRE